MNPAATFSVIHPTLARPAIALRRCDEWYAKADHPDAVEYVFGVHAFDLSTNRKPLEDYAAASARKVRLSLTPLKGSASNWNQAAAAATGQLLIQSQDDLAPPAHWDTELRERLEQAAGAAWAARPIFVGVNDGHRQDRLCITSIMTRTYRDQRGFFLLPEYDGVFADDDSTAQAYDDAAKGSVTFIEARDLVFEHQHFSHPGGMKFDLTYAVENNREGYRRGEALFARRHPRWHREQLCKTPPPASVAVAPSAAEQGRTAGSDPRGGQIAAQAGAGRSD